MLSKKKLAAAALLPLGLLFLSGCESMERMEKNFSSEFGGGLDRTVTVYSESGDVLFQDEGKFDVEISETRIKYIDEDGKLVIFYMGNSSSALVEEKGAAE